MINKLSLSPVTAAGLFMLSISGAYASPQHCIDIGGSGIGNIVNQGTGIAASLTGSVSSARGEIKSSEKTATGMNMKMSHMFMNNTGGMMTTNDDVVLTSVQGKQDQFMINISYHVQQGTTSGTLKGYQGDFKSYGLIDLAIGQVIIRYNGEICK